MTMWVFGYGSLLWNPGFSPAQTCVATLQGYARSFCMRSIHHRGTLADPGLVLALDTAPDAACTGLALAVCAGEEAEVLAGLRARELISSAYYEATVPLSLEDGRQVDALAYIINRAHDQYCGGLPLEEQAQIIAKATGGRGPNRDYLYKTDAHLREMGLADADLGWLAQRVRQLTA